ncbi:hypothetical protein D7Y13_30190 [Corallococcus praedator]|uniref:DUF6310 domain-containing protein n=1 Tax=Corallococcus praedator TaxID=2316724 RepID=A0ABX9QCR7_9BACT|nr:MULTISPECIES: DUF6310 domain-containing protein [Corallococcus]RKH34987.1 hypothetical protein D7X75_06100 [Corallococcus sp. CA031C]RKH97248.1 hypothetical protein D7Y13_30190 [Corallococcus praedator]
MRLRACAALILFISACATPTPSPSARGIRSQRVANLQRAVALPWRDDGQCVVREASQPWAVLIERCYQALDHDRIKFHDTAGRCAVASVGAGAMGVGFCILVAPEIVVGAVIVLGVVVVAVAIKEELDAYDLRHSYPEEAGTSQGTKVASREAEAQHKPKLKPEPVGLDWQPPVPPGPVDRTRRASCEPIPVPHAGEDDPHNECADKFPPNRYPGMDVLVGGVRFDALQVGVRVLWEIKTHRFDSYNDFIRRQEIAKELEQIEREQDAAAACGYGYVIGVSTQAHKDALLRANRFLNVVVTGCKR